MITIVAVFLVCVLLQFILLILCKALTAASGGGRTEKLDLSVNLSSIIG